MLLDALNLRILEVFFGHLSDTYQQRKTIDPRIVSSFTRWPRLKRLRLHASVNIQMGSIG